MMDSYCVSFVYHQKNKEFSVKEYVQARYPREAAIIVSKNIKTLDGLVIKDMPILVENINSRNSWTYLYNRIFLISSVKQIHASNPTELDLIDINQDDAQNAVAEELWIKSGEKGYIVNKIDPIPNELILDLGCGD